MRYVYLKSIVSCLFVIMSIDVLSQVVNVDGIYYKLDTDALTAKVTYQNSGTGKNPDSSYSGDVIIPATFSYDSNEYTVTSIGGSAFYYCRITSLSIPNTVKRIESEAFYRTSISSITIPSSVEYIGDVAFWLCGEIMSMSVEEGNPVYDSRENCNAIIHSQSNTLLFGCNTTVIPNSVTSIGRSAFAGSSYLTTITIPSSVTSIESKVFDSCTRLSSIIIPNSVTYMGTCIFRYCRALQSVSLPATLTSITSEMFKGCSLLKEVNIPETITEIAGYSFSDCSLLESLRIPSLVQSIGSSFISGCQNLKHIYCYAESLPETAPYTFSKSYGAVPDLGKVTLHVPESSLELYKLTEPWSYIATIVPLNDNELTVGKLTVNNHADIDCHTISGYRVSNPQSGLNIIRKSDGTVKKVMVK